MNVDNGHLVSGEGYDRMSDECKSDYEQVPEKLSLSAQLELMGKDETIVGEDATSQIATWARSKRDRLKLKAKRRRMNKLCCQ